MAILRYGGSFLFALAITFGLFFAMQLLIAMGRTELKEEDEFQLVDTRIPPEEQELQRKDRKPPKPKPPEEPPEMPDMDDVTNVRPDSNSTAIGLNLGNDLDMGGIDFAVASDREVLPVVRVQPIYPDRAASRGIEGYCTVEFTVMASGAVDPKSIVVIDAQPSSIFNRATIRAVGKWKYQPKIENGKAVPQYGIRTQLTYNLED